VKIRRTNAFLKDYQKLPSEIQLKVDKQLKLLLTNPRHPSLRLKKLTGTDKYEIRISKGYRATLKIDTHFLELRRVGTHALLKKEG
jgi:mRNA interferase RelE/StbE